MADPTNIIQIDPGAVRAPRAPGLPTPRVADLRVGQEQVATPQVAELPSPLRDLANSLAKGSDETNAVAQLFAKQAGYQAVTRDADGNLQVAKAPIVGDAAVAYHSAIKYTALAMGESEAKQSDIALSQKFQNDPDGYLEAAKAFRDKHINEYARAVGSDVAVELGRTIDNATQQNYKFLVLKQQAKIRADFDSATTAKIQSLDNDIESLAKSGGSGTPEFERLVNQRLAVTRQRVQNPVLGEPPEVAALDLKKFDIKVGGATFVAGLNRILNNPAGGVGVAQTVVNDELTNEKISPAQRQYNYAQGQDTIKEHLQNLQRAVTLRDRAQKDRDEGFEQKVIQDSATGNPQVTENDIKNAANISPEAKMRMLAWQKRDGLPEPMAKVSQTNATDLFRRMDLPDDDPQRISDMRPIRTAYVNGQLTRADEEWLEKRFVESRSPEGDKLKSIRSQFSKAIEPSIDKSNPLLGKIDQDGKLQSYKFERFVDQKVDEYRKAGKSPYDLFDPSKPDYLGKPATVDQFKIPLKQSIEKIGSSLGGTAAPSPAPSAPPQRQPGETPDAYLKRIGQAR